MSVYAKRGTDIYLIHQVRARMDIVKQVETIQMLKSSYPQISAILVEKKANGAAALSLLKTELMGLIPITPTKSKVDRLDGVLPLYHAGNIWYPDPSMAPWVIEHVKEMLTFPNATNDDRVDAETQALSYLGEDYLSRLEALASL
jgi:predicted phage terminase large subunit-like protein